MTVDQERFYLIMRLDDECGKKSARFRAGNNGMPSEWARLHGRSSPNCVPAGSRIPDQAAERTVRRQLRPASFLAHYILRHAPGHAVVLASVLAAVMCAVSTQYGLKHLIDIVSAGPGSGGVWAAFALLCGLIAADNLSWRVGGWVAAHVRESHRRTPSSQTAGRDRAGIAAEGIARCLWRDRFVADLAAPAQTASATPSWPGSAPPSRPWSVTRMPWTEAKPNV